MTITGLNQAATSADVFVSYAHADNEVPHEARYGWVTTMVAELRKILRRLLGGEGATIWMDHRLAASQRIDHTLLFQARSCRTLLLMMSPGYQQSEWCMRELDAFVDATRSESGCDAIFIVEIDKVERKTWHPAIRQVQSLAFWEEGESPTYRHLHGYPRPPAEEHSVYWRRLTELAHLIAERLKQPLPVPLAKPAVWVAETTADVREEHDRLVATLRQHGFTPLPEVPYPRYSDDAYAEALQHDLERAMLMVQLFGRDAGKKLPGTKASPVTVQARAARAAAERRGVPLLRWRPRDVVLNHIKDTTYRSLLTGIQTSTGEEFKQRVVRTLTTPSPEGRDLRPVRQPWADLYILVKADAVDRELAIHTRESLADLGVEVAVAPDPQPQQTPEQIRLAQEEQLQTCDGLVLVYGRTPPSWVQSQFAFSRKVLAQRRRGVWGALLDGPPHPKPDAGLWSPNLLVLECRRGVDATELERFVDALRA